MVLRLVLATILGGIIGLERESSHRPAGLRTHILVCLGSALIMLISREAFSGYPSGTWDPGRLAAQVVSGIGFIGAGTIMHEGVTIRGLTTAASLWVVAGIGLAVGSGYYLGALLTTLLVTVVLLYVHRLENLFFPGEMETISLETPASPEVAKIVTLLEGVGFEVKKLTVETVAETGEIKGRLLLMVHRKKEMDYGQVTALLLQEGLVTRVQFRR